ncbi:putative hydrolase of the HAD superfamily [Kitasatospora sp. MAA4]|uniref:HAD-IA family hydrolase n=1 Tax=Kitasatospora sp. MAA4 TaxID=3035093 RepID=UPI002474A0FE|nr:HAD-IA family hydrolase [Kitasatospora sp. MAA4]MDH6137158.1 putative hydrolase of the HAD superfamily [Kitasatospora sp. MAA4]
MAQEGRYRVTYQVLILDFAGVLTVGMREAGRNFCVREGLQPDAYYQAMRTHPVGQRLYRDIEIGAVTQTEWNVGVATLLGVGSDNLMARLLADTQPEPRLIALAQEARAAGIRTALLSNSFGLEPYNPYRELGVADLFDVTVLSELCGIARPDPAIYRHALEQLGLPGEACVFVDDQEINLPPAATLGMTVVHAQEPQETALRVAGLLGLGGDRVAAGPTGGA